jgi:hypothetical protein
MRAFHDMASTGSAAPSVMVSGVAEVLITTTAGLVVAVPALMLYNHFSRRMNVMLTVAENHPRTLRSAMLDPSEEPVRFPEVRDQCRDSAEVCVTSSPSHPYSYWPRGGFFLCREIG